MNWQKLTASDFRRAVHTCGGVCLLPIGVMEKHGEHLPLGQDAMYIHALSTKAAAEEEAMVFPPYYFGSINEARHQPGTVALDCRLLIPLLENVCDEISRNGLKKIIIVNGHGGNSGFLTFFIDQLRDKDKDYSVFITPVGVGGSEKEKAVLQSTCDGHGGEIETSQALYFFPELVKSNVPAEYGQPLQRLRDYKQLGVRTNINWYADHPEHLRADQTPGSKEKGRKIVEAGTARLTEIIRLVKKDITPHILYRQFRARTVDPTGN